MLTLVPVVHEGTASFFGDLGGDLNETKREAVVEKRSETAGLFFNTDVEVADVGNAVTVVVEVDEHCHVIGAEVLACSTPAAVDDGCSKGAGAFLT